MKVYFGTSPRIKEKYPKQIGEIYRLIENFGYVHTSDWIERVEAKQFYKLTEAELQAHQQDTERAIRRADICIFEASLTSLSVGFLVSMALSNSKVVIVLSQNENSLLIFRSVKSLSLVTLTYNVDDLEEKLKGALEDAKKKISVRFNFFIPRDLLVYLDWVAKSVGLSKGEYVRNLIEKETRKR